MTATADVEPLYPHKIAPEPTVDTGTARDWSTYHYARARGVSGTVWELVGKGIGREYTDAVSDLIEAFSIAFLLDHVTDDVARELAGILDAGDVIDELIWDRLTDRGIDPKQIRRYPTQAEETALWQDLAEQRQAALRRSGHEFYGVVIVDLGENEHYLLAVGEHDDRRVLAAMNAYMRTVVGDRFAYGDPITYAEASAGLTRRHALVMAACRDHLAAEGVYKRGCRDCRREPLRPDDEHLAIQYVREPAHTGDSTPVVVYQP